MDGGLSQTFSSHPLRDVISTVCLWSYLWSTPSWTCWNKNHIRGILVSLPQQTGTVTSLSISHCALLSLMNRPEILLTHNLKRHCTLFQLKTMNSELEVLIRNSTTLQSAATIPVHRPSGSRCLLKTADLHPPQNAKIRIWKCDTLHTLTVHCLPGTNRPYSKRWRWSFHCSCTETKAYNSKPDTQWSCRNPWIWGSTNRWLAINFSQIVYSNLGIGPQLMHLWK